MHKEKVLIIALLLSLTVAGIGQKVAPLPELGKPITLVVDDTQFYVTEGASVYIYSLKDFKLVKKFGKAGQGPQEFQVLPEVPLTVDAQTDRLIAVSLGKISYFTKKGEFVKEVKASSLVIFAQPFGDGFLGMSRTAAEGELYNTVNIYDSKLTKIEEIYRAKSEFQGPGKGLRVLTKPFIYQAYKGKILLPGKDDATVDVFDKNRKKLFSVTLDQEKRAVDETFKKQLIHLLKTDPSTKRNFEILKPIIFPDYLPTIAAFFIESDTIYVMTWKIEKGVNEFFTYDINGKFKKRLMIPIKYETDLKPFPITIHKGKLYQIVENEDEEEWELHVSEIK